MNKISIIVLVLCLWLSQCQYKVVSKDQGSTYIKLQLTYTGTHDYYVKPKSVIIKQLVFHFKAHTATDFSFKIYDPNNQRYEVPQGGIFPQDKQANFSFPITYSDYKINYTQQHFSFQILRRKTDAIIFDSSVVELQFSQYYIQLGTILDSKTLFGYSERFTEHFKLKAGTWTVFNRDHGQMIDHGVPLNGKQTHGYYPAYLTRQKSGLTHMGYFRTSNAMDVQVQSFSNSSFLKIYRVIGGIIDFRFILGDNNPEETIREFHDYLGASAIPPFWSLGFHQCRWGYKNASMLENVIKKYQENDIPLDTIWSDIDYMHAYETFTIDDERFPPDHMRKIIENHRYVPIVEPSIRNREGYAYDQGHKRNIFIKAAQGGDLVGKVWAGDVLFTDYFHPNSTQYWQDMLNYLHKQVPFSGVWLDMNEISNLCDGPCYTPNGTVVMDYTHDLPYSPGGNIEAQTIPLNSTHYNGLLEANAHAFFAMMQAYDTYDYLKNNGQGRPFIITRSNTLGTNRYAFHWTGDNLSNFTWLKMSISSNFMNGLWGLQMVGSDICGFGGNATDQLCARFFQLGSLYPFARNHNQDTSVDQEPYALGQLTLASSKKNLKLRYSLLKSYYRVFVIRKGRGSIFRPVWYQFYDDQNLLQDDIIQTQFLLSTALMSAPILEQGMTTRSVYFPKVSWYNFHTGVAYAPDSIQIIENKPNDLVPLFLRSGYLIMRQDVEGVTQTRHLSNRFQVVGGFKEDSHNATHTVYSCVGGLLSLGDYQDVDEVDVCLREGCEYQMMLHLTVEKGATHKELVLEYSPVGRTVRYSQFINKFTLYFMGDIVTYTPSSEVELFSGGKITFYI